MAQDLFTDQVHELHRLVARQRRLCTMCEEPQALNAALQAEQAAQAAAERPAKRIKVRITGCRLAEQAERAAIAQPCLCTKLRTRASARTLTLTGARIMWGLCALVACT